jgi:hypothetical protein
MELFLRVIIMVAVLFIAESQALEDPFLDPIKATVKKRLKLLTKKEEKAVLKSPVTVNKFKPVIPETLDHYTIEGIAGSKGHYYLIISDPTTGKTFFLKEGDAVAPDTVIKKITFDGVILLKYTMDGGKLKKETVTLKVDTEG